MGFHIYLFSACYSHICLKLTKSIEFCISSNRSIFKIVLSKCSY